ncbi:MAG: hypothetical protein WD907_03705, partial [Bacilli bacterium]
DVKTKEATLHAKALESETEFFSESNSVSLQEQEGDLKKAMQLNRQFSQEILKNEWIHQQLDDYASFSSKKNNRVTIFSVCIAIALLCFALLFYTGPSLLFSIVASLVILFIVGILYGFVIQSNHSSDNIKKQREKKLRQDIEGSNEAIAELKGKIDGVASRLGMKEVSERTVEERLASIEQQRHKHEGWKLLQQREDESQRAVVLAQMEWQKNEERLKQATLTLDECLALWRDDLSKRNVRSSLTPDGVFDLFHLADQAKKLLEGKANVLHKRQTIVEEWGTYTEESAAMSAVFEQRWNEEEWDRCLYSIQSTIDELTQRSTDGNRLIDKKASMLEEECKVTNRLILIEQSIHYLLHEADCEDEEVFRIRARQYEEYSMSEKEIATRKRELELMAHSPQELEQINNYLQTMDLETIHSEIISLKDDIMNMKQTIEEETRSVGKTEQQMKVIANRGDVADILQQRENYVAKLRQDVRKWGTLAICEHLCKKARETYEKERQPNVIRLASDYFKQITEGKYERVVAGMEEKKLFVEQPNGVRLEPHLLSRGTAEQLYLSMRFALAREYSRQVTMPLIMDDVFVNFDRKRLRQVIRTISNVSSHHQILFFSCHPHVTEMMREELADVEHIVIKEDRMRTNPAFV